MLFINNRFLRGGNLDSKLLPSLQKNRGSALIMKVIIRDSTGSQIRVTGVTSELQHITDVTIGKGTSYRLCRRMCQRPSPGNQERYHSGRMLESADLLVFRGLFDDGELNQRGESLFVLVRLTESSGEIFIVAALRSDPKRCAQFVVSVVASGFFVMT